ncbi:MAG: metallopeptidase TldD-related protein [Sphingomonadaceae bacterium]
MIDAATAQDRCAQLIESARRAGADSADAVASAQSSESVSVRLGKLEDVERSESEEVGLRVFVGQRSASIQTSDFSAAAMKELAERAVAMARLAPEDPYSAIADADLLASGPWADLDLEDSLEPSPADLRARALEAEDAARAIKGVTNSEGGSAGFGRSVAGLVTSNGFAGAYGATSHSLSASVIAGEGSAMQRDYAWRSTRHQADLPGPGEIGELAGTRAVARLNPASLKSGPMPVVFDKRVSASLLGHLIGAMSGTAIARRSSFLLDRLREELFPAELEIHEDPLIVRGLRSHPFDGEGLPVSARALVKDRKLTGWLTNLSSARQLGIAPTGHATRGGSGAPGAGPSNVTMAAGSATRDELIADIAEGVLVTELIGHGVNGVTGDYSRGASGFRIVKGEIAGPVAEITVAGNLLAMFANMIPADDLETHRAMNAPSLRVEGMTIAGE